MAQIAQAYFHFHTYLSEAELSRFGRRIQSASRAAAHQNFSIDVRIDIEIEDGSVVGRITAIGAIILSATSLVTNYKGVKDSVKEMCEDARSFGADVCEKAVELAGVNKRQIYRIERRTRTTGKIGRLLGDVERLQNSVKELSPTQVESELARFGKELETIAKDLEPAEQKALEAILEKTKLPPPRKWPRQDVELPKIAAREEQIDLIPAGPQDRPRRRRLRYHSTIEVRPKKSSKRRKQDANLLPK